MQRGLIFALLCALTLREAHGGTIHGMVRAQGRPEMEKLSANPAGYGDRKLKNAPVVDYANIHDFVVYIENITVTNPGPRNYAPPLNVETRSSVNQRGAVFFPTVLPILRGTTVRWLNSDQVYHNVFSISEAATFDLNLLKPDTDLDSATNHNSWTFDKPGRVDVFCSIHANMNCTILVMDNPWFSATDGRGYYYIPNVPPGKYQLKAWHRRIPSQVKEITVPEEGDVVVDFVLGWAPENKSSTNAPATSAAATNAPATNSSAQPAAKIR